MYRPEKTRHFMKKLYIFYSLDTSTVKRKHKNKHCSLSPLLQTELSSLFFHLWSHLYKILEILLRHILLFLKPIMALKCLFTLINISLHIYLVSYDFTVKPIHFRALKIITEFETSMSECSHSKLGIE